MAGLLFVYTRTSIKAAKRNAERHRSADGGQINWRNESLRRHGALEKPEEQSSVKGATNSIGAVVGKGERLSQEEERLRARKIRRGDK